jgi:NADH dehydrogenase FAD-containing subunit
MTHLRNRPRVLVLGGGYAGMLAAARASRGGRAEVTLLDARDRFTQRIRLHEMLAGSEPDAPRYAPLLARRGIRFVQGRAERLDPGRASVTGRTADGARLELGYDWLVLALGSRTADGVPGAAEHAVRLDDPAEVRAAGVRVGELAASGGRVLVVGGGLTGVESAAELAERFPGLRVALATAGSLDEGYAPAAAAHLRGRLAALGVEVREHAAVREVEAGRAWLDDGTAEDFALCLWCGGLQAPALAWDAGFATDACGRVRTDAALRVPGHPRVLAAGDAAAVAGADGRALRMACASALPTGAHAGANVARLLRGAEAEPFRFGFVARCVSLGRRGAVVQWVAPDDAPRGRVWTGRSAVLTKEAICRATLFVVRSEVGAGLPLYRWPGPGRTPAAREAAGLALQGGR